MEPIRNIFDRMGAIGSNLFDAGAPFVSSQRALRTTTASKTLKEVFGLRHLWWKIRKDIPAYILGDATYVHGHDRGDGASECRRRYQNPLLARRFNSLLADTAAALTDILGEPVSYNYRLPLPGFHIFLHHHGIKDVEFARHVDLPHMLIDWERVGKPDFTRTLSFTLPLQIPAAGAGLDIWEGASTATETARAADDVTTDPPRHVPYAVGEIYVHSGQCYHRIARMADTGPADARITLQGHVLRVDEVWNAYW